MQDLLCSKLILVLMLQMAIWEDTLQQGVKKIDLLQAIHKAEIINQYQPEAINNLEVIHLHQHEHQPEVINNQEAIYQLQPEVINSPEVIHQHQPEVINNQEVIYQLQPEVINSPEVIHQHQPEVINNQEVIYQLQPEVIQVINNQEVIYQLQPEAINKPEVIHQEVTQRLEVMRVVGLLSQQIKRVFKRQQILCLITMTEPEVVILIILIFILLFATSALVLGLPIHLLNTFDMLYKDSIKMVTDSSAEKSLDKSPESYSEVTLTIKTNVGRLSLHKPNNDHQCKAKKKLLFNPKSNHRFLVNGQPFLLG
eukprot:TRINITY_DN3166_c0_g2_i1.p2 TRINITY_DN3166_c0_g2~~TRINITY_DN3166_c0_g2_i1.p2  ORF type:complete len:311 (+),score=33.94 TRINITY_DN3166_c0_g2_i1:362-1294(+)